MANPNISEIITTTLQSRTKSLADNVTKNTALLNAMSKKGNVRPVSGGTTILQELEYAENSNFTFYTGYEVIPIAPQDVITSAEFDWKQCAVTVPVSGLEVDIINVGKERMIDMLSSKIKNAEKTMMNGISTGIYSDGTGYGGKQIGGLQSLVADDPTTGTVGGINRANYSFWRNVKFDATTDGSAAATAANIGGYMNKVYNQLVRGTDMPDLIVADANYFTFYLESLQANQRFASAEKGESGFQALKFRGADVLLDGGQGGACPTNHMYFLNTDYIHFRPSSNRNMKVLEVRNSVNQDASVHMIAWAGNMTLSNASLQGVLKD